MASSATRGESEWLWTDLDQFASFAQEWLLSVARPVAERAASSEDSCRELDVSVFRSLSFEDEQSLLEAAMAWQRQKFDAGFGALSWPTEYGGAGLLPAFERVFETLESSVETPARHETFAVTLGLIAPTIRAYGTEEQKDRWIRKFLRTEELCCQLFSEPGAGSDLASMSTRAVRDGEGWLIQGQKVWTSGAQFAAWGELIARTDPSASKHAGLTAFIIPMDSPGIDIRPIRQMSGGHSFNEVFFDSVWVPDSCRLGDPGAGWQVALATLGFERAGSGGGRVVGGSAQEVLELARRMEKQGDARARQLVAEVYVADRIRQFVDLRVEIGSTRGEIPGPEGSIGKLLWTRHLTQISDAVAPLLGARLAADTGEWGAWCWAEHVLGAPGYRIAGGSDEIQHNIIGERVLGLPREDR